MNSNYNKSSILEILDNEPRISHRIIAKHTENSHISIRKLIDKHKENFELFGRLSFEMTTQKTAGGKQEIKTFFLNEQQATLLLTFMRNNEIVINFKVRLVKEFFEMRQLLLKSPNSQPVQTPQTLENLDLDLQISQNRKLLELIELITSQNPKNLFFLDKIYKKLKISSPLDFLEIDLNSFYFIPTELGKFVNKSAVEVNKILEKKGFQEKINGVWTLTEIGEKYAIQLDNNFHTIKWKLQSLI